MYLDNTPKAQAVEISHDEFNLLVATDNTVNAYKSKSRKSDSEINELIASLKGKGIEVCRISAGVGDYFRIPNVDHKAVKREAVLNFYQQHKQG